MRRTLWVVPRELVGVVQAAATRTVAARERRRLEGFVAASGVTERPGRWLDTVEAVALEAIAERGEAFTTDLTRSTALLATKLRLGEGRWGIEVSAGSRILPLLAAQGMLARGRPRTTWVNGQYRWSSMEALARLADRAGRTGRGAGGARPPLARGLRARNGGRPPLVDGLDGSRGPGGARRRASCGRRARRRGDGLRARRRSRADEAAEAVGRPAARARSDHDGLEAAGLVRGRPRARPLRHERQRGADGVVRRTDRRGLGPAQGRLRSPFRLLEDVGDEAVRAVEAEAERLGQMVRRRAHLAQLPAAVPASAGAVELRRVSQSAPRKISLAITSRWICDVPS